MLIVNYFELDDKLYWLNKISESNWGASTFLVDIIKNNTIFQLLGDSTKLLLLIDNNDLISFCTLSDFDDVQPTTLSPWIGFVYTFKKYRGYRYSNLLIEECLKILKDQGKNEVFISTNHIGLYEKYNFEFLQIAKDISNEDTRIYRRCF